MLRLTTLSSAQAVESRRSPAFPHHYPEYCTTPQEQDTRRIPLLATKDGRHDRNANTATTTATTTTTITTMADEDGRMDDHYVYNVRQVTAVVRHGTRTPSTHAKCWAGFWGSAETGVWDCRPHDLTELQMDDPTTPGGVWLEKTYDALRRPHHNSTESENTVYGNILNGTCQYMQLLLRGYEQEVKNGKVLADAYGHQWFDEQQYDNPDHRFYHEPTLRFRSDDDQRTLLSGQALLRGLLQRYLEYQQKNSRESTKSFGQTYGWLGNEHEHNHNDNNHHHLPIIPIHTAGRNQDILSPNPLRCPRLDTIRYSEALQTPEYHTFQNRTYKLRKQLLRMFGTEEIGISCLMGIMCTDRKLPHSLLQRTFRELNLAGTKHATNGLFQRIVDYVSTDKWFVRSCLFCFLFLVDVVVADDNLDS